MSNSIEITGLAEVQKKLQKLNSNLTGAQMQDQMQTIGNMLKTSIVESFENSSSPFGEIWKPAARGGQALLDSGHLMNSFTVTADSNSVTVGTNTKYAAIHQFGGVIKPKNKKTLKFQVGGKWVTKKEVTIPARPFLPIDSGNRLAPHLLFEIEEYLKGEIKKISN